MSEKRLISKKELEDITDSHVIDRFWNSLEPASEWIPVSERLPKKDMSYLVTYVLPSGAYAQTIGFFIMKVGWLNMDEDIIAWRELPEPYKGE